MKREIMPLSVQESIRTGVSMDVFLYKGMPVIAGYRKVREPSESISIILVLEDGIPFKPEPVKIFTRSGDDRYLNADKMILKFS